MASKFFFSLDSIKPQRSFAGGSLTTITTKEAPGFINISYANLHLKKRGSLEPLWHPNANKIGYSTQGRVLVTLRTPKAAETFTVKQGELFFIPKGYVHHIENIGDEDAILSFALDNTNPEEMYLSKAIHTLSDSVFTATFKTPAKFVDGLKNSKNSDIIKVLPPLQKEIKDTSSDYKFDIEDSDKPVLTKGGYLQLGTKNVLPTLKGLGILGFGLTPKGVVEPHWHTNAGELVYIVKGKTVITVLSPDGKVETLNVNGGQGAFAPASHFHNIENVGTDDVQVIAFFTHEDPDYIGIGEVAGSYNNDLLASVFNVAPSYFDSFKKPKDPQIIVPL